jgi:pantoate--beta-alanine ligase
MKTVSTLADFRAEMGEKPRVFVPTMGALHDGHAELIRRGAAIARERGLTGGCVVSIFVNPTQFNEQSDFARYPRTLDADLAMCRDAGATCVIAPSVQEVYPAGVGGSMPLPPQATEPRLEDAHRPGHFAGVCQVVKRLFEMVEPRFAIFGEKDWQQYRVIDAMSRALGLGVEVVAAPTVRECDGLAMSSRNRFLTEEDRIRGLTISRALYEARGLDSPSEAEESMRRTLSRAEITPDYAVVRDADTLGPWKPGAAGRALIAARVGTVRLLDNAPWGPKAP